MYIDTDSGHVWAFSPQRRDKDTEESVKLFGWTLHSPQNARARRLFHPECPERMLHQDEGSRHAVSWSKVASVFTMASRTKKRKRDSEHDIVAESERKRRNGNHAQRSKSISPGSEGI